MRINFNANIKLLMGGSYCGGSEWNKAANDIDNCFKLYFLRAGEAEITGKSKKHLIQEQNLYFVNGYAIQSQKVFKKMVVDWIHFQPESVYFNYILKFAPCICQLNIEEFQSFKPLFPLLNKYFLDRLDHASERVVKLQIQAFIQFALAQVLNSLDKHIFENDNSFLRLLPALEYINTHYNKEINLKQIATKCFLSPNYFHRLFTQTFNISPSNYVRQMQMEEALRQLVYTNKSIKEIAYTVGFDDEAYFSRAFSKIYGTSPGRYRKSNQNKLP